MKLVRYKEHGGRVFDIDLAAPPEERWVEAAEKFGDQVHKLLEHVEEVVDDHLSTFPLGLQIPLRTMLGPSKVAASYAVRLFGQEYAAEIKGISDTIGARYRDLVVANLMYDVSQVLGLSGACSSASLTNRAGSPILARNLDWGTPDSIGEHTVVCRFHGRGGSFISIGVAGFVGVLSAQRNRAWALTLNQAPAGDLRTRVTHMPVCMHLRAACDRSMTFRSLVRSVTSLQTISPFFAHVVGIEREEQTVISGHGGEYSRRDAERGILVQTNHSVGDEEETSEDVSSLARYYALVRRIEKQRPTTIEGAQRVLKGAPVTYESTMQSMVLCPAASRFVLSIRPNEEWAADNWCCPSCDRDVHCVLGPGTYECPYADCGELFHV